MTAAAEHDAVRELSGLYVLGALADAERARFDEHLRVCAECVEEVRSLRAVTAGLPLAVPQVEPSASLRERVLAGVMPDFSRADTKARLKPASPTALPAWLAAAAMLAIAAGLGWYTVRLRDRLAVIEAQLQQALQRASNAETQVARASGAASEARATLAILSAPDLARIDLAGQPAAPAARARAFWSRSRGLVFAASNLPPLPAGRTYQLWVVTARAPVSAGLLKPDAAGSVNAVIATPPDLPTPVAMAVTMEPEGGVPAPTGERYLIGTP